MLIRSQDKKSLINMSNTCQLFIGRSENTNTKIYADFQDGISDSIGTYSTEAKAIKVLDKIQDYYMNTINTRCRVFQMPSNEEVEG